MSGGKIANQDEVGTLVISSEEATRKSEELFRLAGMAANVGDFRLAAKLYEDARKWLEHV